MIINHCHATAILFCVGFVEWIAFDAWTVVYIILYCKFAQSNRNQAKQRKTLKTWKENANPQRPSCWHFELIITRFLFQSESVFRWLCKMCKQSTINYDCIMFTSAIANVECILDEIQIEKRQQQQQQPAAPLIPLTPTDQLKCKLILKWKLKWCRWEHYTHEFISKYNSWVWSEAELAVTIQEKTICIRWSERTGWGEHRWQKSSDCISYWIVYGWFEIEVLCWVDGGGGKRDDFPFYFVYRHNSQARTWNGFGVSWFVCFPFFLPFPISLYIFSACMCEYERQCIGNDDSDYTDLLQSQYNPW